MNELQVHPAAKLFPLMDEERFSALVESIRHNGLLNAIVLLGGKILDGRNRYAACLKAGVEPHFTDFVGDPYCFVWLTNGERRDLKTDQRFAIWKTAVKESGELQKQVAAIEAEANRKRSEATKKQPRTEDGARLAGSATSSGSTRKPKHTQAEAMAVASHTNRGTVERMNQLETARPDLFEKVQQGELTGTAAMRQMKKSQVAQKVKELPDGKFRVIYADPPWKYNDEREGLGTGDGATVDRASTAASDHYPTMSFDELKALDVAKLAAPDCVLFCWATLPLLPEQLEVIKAWGFKYKTAFVWHKPQGSFGHYHKADAELLFVATKGSCTPDSDTRESQVQTWARGRHSAKPEDCRAMIDRMYLHGPRIELFRRGDVPAGWVAWGAETEEAAA
jgi:N6-adenosine-specific RNA methylase IME4